MAGVVFVNGEHFPMHWQAALEAGFWETERKTEVKPGDVLIFWQAGYKELLGLGRATGPVEPVDYRVQDRPWSEDDGRKYLHRYRFEPINVRLPAITWRELMILLDQKPRRGPNTAPVRFNQSTNVVSSLESFESVGSDRGSAVEIGAGFHGSPSERERRAKIGIGGYIRANESIKTKDGLAFRRDPQQVDRGFNAHASTQNQLADWLTDQGLEPLSPGAVNFDLAWRVNGQLYVAEVKSLHPVTFNERNQIRLGIGEVIDFAHRLGGARRVLALEREPSDREWPAICDEVGVRLVWPRAFERLLPWG